MNNKTGILEFTCDVERLPGGNTLITDAGDELGKGSEVFEVDDRGNIVWQCTCVLCFAHSAKRLDNGNTLIADTLNNRIIEVDHNSQIIFTSDTWGKGTGTLSDGSHLNYPNDITPLSDGSLLITDRNNDRCLIAGRDGTVIWQFSEGLKHPHNADMSSDDTILICNSDINQVWEIDRTCNSVIWRYGDREGQSLSFPRDADRLKNGNTLITDSRNHRILEVTPSGETIWQYQVDYYASFYEADMLENGHILIADQHHHQVTEIDRAGNILWQFRNRRNDKAIYPRLFNGFFKKLDDNGFPFGWYLYTRFAEGGGKYLGERINMGEAGIAFDRHGILCLIQYLEVHPGETYHFSGSIRTEDVENGCFACFQFFFLDEYGGPISNTMEAPKTQMLTGTNDWQPQKLSATAPQKAHSMEFRLMLNGKGHAYMKELLLYQ